MEEISVRPKRRWKYNLKTNIKQIGCDDERIHLVQEDWWWALMNTVRNIWAP